jgi:hypothetical protein
MRPCAALGGRARCSHAAVLTEVAAHPHPGRSRAGAHAHLRRGDVGRRRGGLRARRPLERPGIAEDLYRAISAALAAAQGPRTTEEALLDRLSSAVQARRARVKAAPSSPAISAVLVRMNLEIGLAPEPMRATLSSEKGRAMLEEGLRALGAHLVKGLLRA